MANRKKQQGSRQPANTKAAVAKKAKAPKQEKPKAAAPATPATDQKTSEPKRTIKALVAGIFEKNPGATNAELTAAVKTEFPSPRSTRPTPRGTACRPRAASSPEAR